MAKQIMFDDNGRRHMKAGIHKLAEAVRVTLGPTGRNVMLGLGGKVRMTKDGDSVAKEVEVECPFENMGAKLINEVSSRTNKEVGDGTTTSVVLADQLVAEGHRFVAAGVSPIALRNGMLKATKEAIKYMTGQAKPIEGRKSIEQVATIASNSDKAVGKIMAEAMTKVGEKGVITVEKGDGFDVELNLVSGMEFDKGYVSPYFVNDKTTGVVRLEKPLLLITDHKISSIRDIVPILEKVVVTKRPLFIVADDVEGEALAGLLINRLRGVMECVAIKAPAFGDRRKAQLEDLAIVTGGSFLSKELGFDWGEVTVEDLGTCQRIEVHKGRTVFFNGKGASERIAGRKVQIEAQIEQSTSSYDREKLEERLGRLEGKVAVIKVGSVSEIAMNERKDRVDDSLNATKAAMEEGVVPGAGTTFLHAIPHVLKTRATGDEKFGVEVVARALRAPIEQLGENVGIDGPALAAEVEELEEGVGYDAARGKMCDLVAAGVIDPVKVLRVALQNAVSVASLALITDAMVADAPSNEKVSAGAVS